MKIVFKKEPRMGDVFFTGDPKPGFYSKAVMYFTKSRWSHCFFICVDYLSQRVVFESDLKAQLVPFEKQYIVLERDYYEGYRPTKARQSDIEKACVYTFNNTAGQTYGFLSIPWFAVREVIYWITGKKLFKNWYTKGSICSESLLMYLLALPEPYKEAFQELTLDETSPEDIYRVVKSRPDLFEYIGKREVE